jgi:hypothetical protein
MARKYFFFAFLILAASVLLSSCGKEEKPAPIDSTLLAQGTFRTVRLYSNNILQDTILVNVLRVSEKKIMFQQQDGLEYYGDIVESASNGFTFLINRQNSMGKAIEGVKTKKEDDFHGWFDAKEARNQAFGFKIKIGTSTMLYSLSRVK